MLVNAAACLKSEPTLKKQTDSINSPPTILSIEKIVVYVANFPFLLAIRICLLSRQSPLSTLAAP